MTLLNRWLVRLICLSFLILLVLSLPNAAFAQQQPTSLSITPSSLIQGQCYTMQAGNGANMTLDVKYQFNGAEQPPIIGWPTLDSTGSATICTSTATAVGTYTYVGIRNTQTTDQTFW